MYIYEVTFSILSLNAIISRFGFQKRIKDILYWISAVWLIVLFAFQDPSVGPDTGAYMEYFRAFRILPLSSALKYNWEPGYILFNWILGRFFSNDRAIVIAMSLVTLIPIFCWIKRESSWPELGLVIFVGTGIWNMSMGIFRQFLAMAILTCSYKYIREQKFWKFLLTVIAASLFHQTAVVFLFAYFVYKIPMDSKALCASALASVILWLSGNKIFQFLSVFSRIKYEASTDGGGMLLLFLWVCLIGVFVAFKGHIPSTLKLHYMLVLVAAAFQIIALNFAVLARVVLYFSASLVILLPNFMIEFTQSKNRSCRIPMGIIICGVMFVWFKLTISEPYVFM